MALENLERENNQTEEELRRLKVASSHLYAGTVSLLCFIHLLTFVLRKVGAEGVCALTFGF